MITLSVIKSGKRTIMLYTKSVSFKSNDSLTHLYNFIKPQTTVLDVGCACGGLAEALVKNKNCHAYGLEYNSQSVEACQKLNVFEEIHQQDLNYLQTNDYPSWVKKFDYIVCGDVLEHLMIPDNVLHILLSYLKDDGEILISLPNVAHASIKATLLQDNFTYTDLGILDKTHLHFYTYKTIAAFLHNHHLSLLEMSPVFLPLDGYQKESFSDLSPEIQKYIEKDKHSSIVQYVMRCKVDINSSFKNNLHILNSFETDDSTSISTYSFKLKRFILTSVPFTLKWIEKIRKFLKV